MDGAHHRRRQHHGLAVDADRDLRRLRADLDPLRGRNANGVVVLTAKRIEISTDAPQIPVGIDGEAVILPAPVVCTIQPGALRVWVPRNRPGVPRPKPEMNWARLRQLALGSRRA